MEENAFEIFLYTFAFVSAFQYPPRHCKMTESGRGSAW